LSPSACSQHYGATFIFLVSFVQRSRNGTLAWNFYEAVSKGMDMYFYPTTIVGGTYLFCFVEVTMKKKLLLSALCLIAGVVILTIYRMCDVVFIVYVLNGAWAFVVSTMVTIVLIGILIYAICVQHDRASLPGIIACIAWMIYSSYRFLPYFHNLFSL
jgi:hypothetical protein